MSFSILQALLFLNTGMVDATTSILENPNCGACSALYEPETANMLCVMTKVAVAHGGIYCVMGPIENVIFFETLRDKKVKKLAMETLTYMMSNGRVLLNEWMSWIIKIENVKDYKHMPDINDYEHPFLSNLSILFNRFSEAFGKVIGRKAWWKGWSSKIPFENEAQFKVYYNGMLSQVIERLLRCYTEDDKEDPMLKAIRKFVTLRYLDDDKFVEPTGVFWDHRVNEMVRIILFRLPDMIRALHMFFTGVNWRVGTNTMDELYDNLVLSLQSICWDIL